MNSCFRKNIQLTDKGTFQAFRNYFRIAVIGTCEESVLQDVGGEIRIKSVPSVTRMSPEQSVSKTGKRAILKQSEALAVCIRYNAL